MSKIKDFTKTIKANKGPILKRAAIIGVGLAAVSLTAGVFLVKLRPPEELFEMVQDIVE